mmetsp:Transcript_24913/g.59369  ORF Transcript_24913/g.59369 Transcript_24913/m.59369 type:complete len:243 (-) Transcript_24913:66-794(-)
MHGQRPTSLRQPHLRQHFLALRRCALAFLLDCSLSQPLNLLAQLLVSNSQRREKILGQRACLAFRCHFFQDVHCAEHACRRYLALGGREASGHPRQQLQQPRERIHRHRLAPSRVIFVLAERESAGQGAREPSHYAAVLECCAELECCRVLAHALHNRDQTVEVRHPLFRPALAARRSLPVGRRRRRNIIIILFAIRSGWSWRVGGEDEEGHEVVDERVEQCGVAMREEGQDVRERLHHERP